MQKVGVILLDDKQHQLQCAACRAVWRVVKRGLRFPKGYWKCPNGCNAKADAGAGRAQAAGELHPCTPDEGNVG